MKVKTVFFGTHDFAATILEGLLKSDIVSVDLIFTQPDRKTGRKQTLEESPVKKLALKHNLKLEQPESLKNLAVDLSEFDLAIVAQYGLIIPKKIIDSFSKGMINVHGSLLPKYRGASPIQAALVNGETETGVTIMLMDEKMDHGPILSQKEMQIDADDTYTTLASKMAEIGLDLLLKTLPEWLNGNLKPQEQDENQATFTKLLTKEDGLVDFNKTNEEIYNQYRGLTPWPGIWFMRNGKRLKLLKIKKSEKNLQPGEALMENTKVFSSLTRDSKQVSHPLARLENKQIFIGCNQGSIEVLELQLEGKNVMSAAEFLNGYKI